MDYLILSIILAGSALMVYNIIRYLIFIKSNRELEENSVNNGVTLVPLVLLIFFLVGYVIVGLSGIANALIAAILFGGSVFVSILLWVMFSIIGHVRDTEKILAARYQEMKHEIDALTKDSTAMIRVNLTKDEIEERAGEYLYDSDYEFDKYSELIKERFKYLMDPEHYDTEHSPFRREELLRRYQEGATEVKEVTLARRKDGTTSFVRIDAMMTKKPVSGDVVAFIVERPYNEEVVRRSLLEKVLMDEYDRIAFIVDGKYRVLISNPGQKEGLLLKDAGDDTYESVYFNYILPAMSFDRKANEGKANPLRLSVIEEELADKDRYEVDAPFVIDGESLYKHFVFYRIDKNAKFYLMLLSDSTRVREEQEKKTRELSDALEKAMRSNEARVRFFTNISHNVRTPMNGILGFAELALKEDDIETIRSYLTKLDVSAKRLLALMTDLFTMSHIDSGTLKLECQPTDLAELSKQIVSHVSELRPEKELSVVADTSGLKNTCAVCDSSHLTQIVERLLFNSVSFAPNKSRVTLFVSKEDGGYLFRIANKANKIPKDVIDHIFETDTWEEQNGIDDISGAGLGMSVAKALIDSMGGTVNVISTDDEIVFELLLPFKEVCEEKAPAAAAPEGEIGSLRLLVADDNEINREIAQLLLSGEGHKVDLAVNGAEAVEKVKANVYDAVLMDVQMPVMNGFEATAAIRALPDPELASIPIIAMTANAYHEDQNEALNAGMNGYVPKPINPDAIRAALAKALAK